MASNWVYVRFVGGCLGLLALALLIGYIPTVRLAGDDAVPAMMAGCAASLIGSMCGGAAIKLASAGRMKPALAILASMAARFFVVIALAAYLAMTASFDVQPLLVWIGLSYAVLLIPDTALALRISRPMIDVSGGGSG